MKAKSNIKLLLPTVPFGNVSIETEVFLESDGNQDVRGECNRLALEQVGELKKMMDEQAIEFYELTKVKEALEQIRKEKARIKALEDASRMKALEENLKEEE